jgi:hypothetical protein
MSKVKIKLSLGDILTAHAAIKSLSNYEVPVANPQGGPDTVASCRNALGGIGLHLIQNTAAFGKHVSTYSDARNDLIKELSGGKDSLSFLGPDGPEIAKKFNETNTDWMKEERAVKVFTIPLSKLRTDVNRYSLDQVAFLMEKGIIVDDSEEENDEEETEDREDSKVVEDQEDSKVVSMEPPKQKEA